jgi:hypothetical protein
MIHNDTAHSALSGQEYSVWNHVIVVPYPSHSTDLFPKLKLILQGEKIWRCDHNYVTTRDNNNGVQNTGLPYMLPTMAEIAGLWRGQNGNSHYVCTEGIKKKKKFSLESIWSHYIFVLMVGHLALLLSFNGVLENKTISCNNLSLLTNLTHNRNITSQ